MLFTLYPRSGERVLPIFPFNDMNVRPSRAHLNGLRTPKRARARASLSHANGHTQVAAKELIELGLLGDSFYIDKEALAVDGIWSEMAPLQVLALALFGITYLFFILLSVTS